MMYTCGNGYMINSSTLCVTFPPFQRSRSTIVQLCLLVLSSSSSPTYANTASALHSQIVSRDNIVTIHNDYVGASVKMDQNAGRFWISAGSKNGWHRYLYHGSKAVQNITSNVVFRINNNYYCNTTDDFALGPRPATLERLKLSSDRMIASAIQRILLKFSGRTSLATISLCDLSIEDPPTIYDDGADVLIEFEYQNRPNIPNIGTLWIFLMLDGDNGAAKDAGTGGGGDKSSIMTTQGYFPSYSAGRSLNPDNKTRYHPSVLSCRQLRVWPGY